MFDNLFTTLDDWFHSHDLLSDYLPDHSSNFTDHKDSIHLDSLTWVHQFHAESYLDNTHLSDLGWQEHHASLGIENDHEPLYEWGTPMHDAACWHQQQGNSDCAVVAQISVYESLTGVHLSEADACQIAAQHSWFDPQTGTQPENVGKLLEALGVPVHQSYDASLSDIATALEHGDKVIVGLNANEIWYPQHDPLTGQPMQQSDAGHAVWVTGIEQAADGSVKVILNDSGTPDGRMETIDAQDFLNAWHDHNNFMVVADSSAPSTVA